MTRHYLHPLYSVWRTMHQRCSNPSATSYDLYGQRGITVCPRWNEFTLFITDMGERPIGHTLDRIDNSLGYSPSNCRWSTPAEQASNRRLYRPHKSSDPLKNITVTAHGKYRVRIHLAPGLPRVQQTFSSLEDAQEFRSTLEMEREMHRLLNQ